MTAAISPAWADFVQVFLGSTASAGDWLGGVWCRDVGVEREEAENQFQHLLFCEGYMAVWQKLANQNPLPQLPSTVGF